MSTTRFHASEVRARGAERLRIETSIAGKLAGACEQGDSVANSVLEKRSETLRLGVVVALRFAFVAKSVRDGQVVVEIQLPPSSASWRVARPSRMTSA